MLLNFQEFKRQKKNKQTHKLPMTSSKRNVKELSPDTADSIAEV